jgi:hypothetical protein
MQETLGTLNLKIARLEQHLKVLRQQQILSSAYPDYQANLARKELALRTYLNQLIVSRDLFLQRAGQSIVGRSPNGKGERDQSLWSTA